MDGIWAEGVTEKLIHECCLLCMNMCKEDYTSWTGCMPCGEYCENHAPNQQLIDYINKLLESG